jgi:hypothetical protein
VVNQNSPGTGVRTQGSLTVDQPNGSVALAINDELTAVLTKPTKGNWYYDIKEINASGSCVRKSGLVAMSDAVTKALS